MLLCLPRPLDFFKYFCKLQLNSAQTSGVGLSFTMFGPSTLANERFKSFKEVFGDEIKKVHGVEPAALTTHEAALTNPEFPFVFKIRII